MVDMLSALRASQERLARQVASLSDADLTRRSYASQWSIAQVLSHLGSQAEITGLMLDAGLGAFEPPEREVIGAIWDRWNAKTPREQADDMLAADATVLAKLESLDAEQRAGLQLNVFGMDLDFAAFAGMRLNEHALHSWDVAVALDPDATIPAESVEHVVDRLGMIASRSGRPAAGPVRVAVTTTAPDRRFALSLGDPVSLAEAAEAAGAEPTDATLELPAEALIRLVYGRLDPAHTPEVAARGIELDELRRAFPGV
jgi:uncharacterized protein (TIGR03083 family)